LIIYFLVGGEQKVLLVEGAGGQTSQEDLFSDFIFWLVFARRKCFLLAFELAQIEGEEPGILTICLVELLTLFAAPWLKSEPPSFLGRKVTKLQHDNLHGFYAKPILASFFS
jgi:hypothetical protein